MKKLIAEFSIRLPGFLLISGPEENTYKCQAKIDGFDVELIILPCLDGIKSKKKDDRYYTFSATEMKISVAGDEFTPPPELLGDSVNYASQYEYFESRLGKYQVAAQKAVNRTILYLRYKLHVPGLHPLLLMSDEGFYNPEWVDEKGINVGKGLEARISDFIPGISDFSPNVKPLTVDELPELENALNNCIKFELHEEILADAHDAIYDAIFQGNLRRAVLEMAIAVEIAVKQAYFGRETISGMVINYLEDKGRLNVKIIELIDTISVHAFGSSFRKANKQAYDHIDFLFRCRNKVAHRGEVTLGHGRALDWSTLITWWQSVVTMFDWLNSIQSE